MLCSVLTYDVIFAASFVRRRFYRVIQSEIICYLLPRCTRLLHDQHFSPNSWICMHFQETYQHPLYRSMFLYRGCFVCLPAFTGPVLYFAKDSGLSLPAGGRDRATLFPENLDPMRRLAGGLQDYQSLRKWSDMSPIVDCKRTVGTANVQSLKTERGKALLRQGFPAPIISERDFGAEFANKTECMQQPLSKCCSPYLKEE